MPTSIITRQYGPSPKNAPLAFSDLDTNTLYFQNMPSMSAGYLPIPNPGEKQVQVPGFGTLIYAAGATVTESVMQQVGGFGGAPATIIVSGGFNISGSLTAVSFTSSLLGTASYSNFAQTSSYVSGSNVKGTVSSSFTASLADTATTASYIVTAQTASYIATAQTASYVLTASTSSYVSGSNVKGTVSSSYTASIATTASYVATASYSLTALSASYAPSNGGTFPYTGSAGITGSLRVDGFATVLKSFNVGTATGSVTGEINASADVIAFSASDINLKTSIRPIENPIAKLKQISGNVFVWKEGFEEIHSHRGEDIGVIAQEIETVLPQVVTVRDSGYKAVNYEKIVALLIEAVKAQQVEIDELKAKL